MQAKPEPKSRVYVTARDKKTGQSKSLTLYDTTPDHIIDLLRDAAEPASDPSEKRQAV